MKERSVVYVQSGADRLELYLREPNGRSTYLMTHRFNPTLFNYLRNGRTVKDLRGYRPGRNRGEKAIEGAVRQVVRVVDWLAAEEAAEAAEMALAG